MTMKLLTTEDLVELFRGQFAKTYIRDVITHRPDFPRPIVIGRTRFWPDTDLMRWLESRKSA